MAPPAGLVLGRWLSRTAQRGRRSRARRPGMDDAPRSSQPYVPSGRRVVAKTAVEGLDRRWMGEAVRGVLLDRLDDHRAHQCRLEGLLVHGGRPDPFVWLHAACLRALGLVT